jgi:DinB superfamily
MDAIWRNSLWSQFGAAMDMLENAIAACPEELWNDRSQRLQYWYIAFHALFWLDLYLSGSAQGFSPPAPFTLDELDPSGLLPDRVYSKDELQAYLEYSRQKCRATIKTLTDKKAQEPCKFPWGEVSFSELLLYNMRHVQEHASQLNLILGDKTGAVPGWVKWAEKLDGSA